MERSIVCGVDDSDAGRSALGTADWLAARLDARLIALHTALLTVVGSSGYGALRRVTRALRRQPVRNRTAGADPGPRVGLLTHTRMMSVVDADEDQLIASTPRPISTEAARSSRLR